MARKKKTLTEEDALADLEGRPRPSPSAEAAASLMAERDTAQRRVKELEERLEAQTAQVAQAPRDEYRRRGANVVEATVAIDAFIERLFNRDPHNGPPSIGIASAMPNNHAEAFERAKEGSVPLYAPEYRVGPEIHALSEVIQLRRDVRNLIELVKHIARAQAAR